MVDVANIAMTLKVSAELLEPNRLGPIAAEPVVEMFLAFLQVQIDAEIPGGSFHRAEWTVASCYHPDGIDSRRQIDHFLEEQLPLTGAGCVPVGGEIVLDKGDY